MRRYGRRVGVVAIPVLVVVGLFLLAAPKILRPADEDAAAAALTAYRSAGTATVHVTARTADGRVLADGTVRRDTADNTDARVLADLDRLTLTDAYRNVHARVADGHVYTKNFDTMGGTPWVRLRTDGHDDVSLALAMADPAAMLRFAESNGPYTMSRRSGVFGKRYEVQCHDCAAPFDAPASADTGASGAGAVPPVDVSVYVMFDVGLGDRPTAVAVRVVGRRDVRVTMVIDGYGDDLSVRAPAHASPSPTPERYS